MGPKLNRISVPLRRARDFLLVPWLRPHFPMQRVLVRSLVRNYDSTCLVVKKKKNHKTVVTNSIKTLKVVHIKKKS